MDISVDDLLEKAFVITINQKRLDAFMKRWDTYELPRPRPFWGFRIPGGTVEKIRMTEDGNYANCALSHFALVKMAEAMDLPYIFILEDDALPSRHVLENLPKELKGIPDDTWVLRLGMLPTNKEYVKYQDQTVRQENIRSGGSHAYVVFKSYYRKYEEIFYTKDTQPDRHLINHYPDVHGGGRIRISVAVPTLFEQKEPLEGYKAMTPQNLREAIAANAKYGGDFDFS